MKKQVSSIFISERAVGLGPGSDGIPIDIAATLALLSALFLALRLAGSS
jgi:hypothetical protein